MDSTRGPALPSVDNSQSCLPLSKRLKDGDIILLLTPGVVPEVSPLNRDPKNPPSDPFEPLGKALARHHPWVRHVPYLPRNGITGTHVVHIRLAAAVIFVISGPPRHGQPAQVALAEITRELCEHRPQVILACCDVQELGALEKSFPTIIQAPSFAPLDLEAAADALFAEPRKLNPAEPNVQNLILSPKPWRIEVWNADRDVSETLDLWHQCMPEIFRLTRYRLQSLLRRDGYAMHYVVREPGASQILGFCATYTTYADSGGERLLGSFAALLVHPSYRQRGIGLSLHDYALRQLTKTRGVCRLQLGSAFPRLLYGLPVGSPFNGWFRRRGWPIEPPTTTLDTGQDVVDWLLKFKDWPVIDLMPSSLTFRPCEFTEFDMVLSFVDKESRKKDNMGWYDQYAKLANTMNIRDIILGFEGGTIIAAALTYAKNTGSPAADDLPWASAIADDVGGVTCICVSGE
jgi:GNAT superfamily N-acetyltransferase